MTVEETRNEVVDNTPGDRENGYDREAEESSYDRRVTIESHYPESGYIRKHPDRVNPVVFYGAKVVLR